MSNLEQTQKQEETQEETQDEKEVQPLSRQHTRYEKPCILSLDYDLYVIKSGTTYKIISSITDKEVENRMFDPKIHRITKIDPSIQEEDRRLIKIRNSSPGDYILQEDHYRQLGYNY